MVLCNPNWINFLDHEKSEIYSPERLLCNAPPEVRIRIQERNRNLIRNPNVTAVTGVRLCFLAVPKYIVMPDVYHVSRKNYDTIRLRLEA